MPDKPSPVISVICVSLNHSAYIEKALQSLFNQSYKNLEIVYIDACSDDDTYEKGCMLLTKSGIPHKTFRNNPRKNMPANMNLGLANVTGEFVSVLSCDDWLHTECYEQKLKVFMTTTDVSMVYSGGYFYYDKENATKEIISPFPSTGNIYEKLLSSNFLHTQGTLTRRKVYDVIGKYDESLSIEDWDMSLRIAKEHPIFYIPEKHFYYRMHSMNMSISPKPAYYEDCFKILKKHRDNKAHFKGVDWLMPAYIRSSLANSQSSRKTARQIMVNSGSRLKTFRYLFNLFKRRLQQTRIGSKLIP